MVSGAIGFLDSGVGGLTVLKAAKAQLPSESMIFVGDQARVPYGPRPSSEVVRFSREIAGFLTQQSVKALVMACNTATAAALPLLQQELPMPVIGVIQAGSQRAVTVTTHQRIGVIATEGTCKSHAYRQAIQALMPNATVYEVPCPEFVLLVEAGNYRSAEATTIVQQRLAFFKDRPVDTLILGCTHYPLLLPQITAAMGPGVQLVDSGVETAKQLRRQLTTAKLLTPTAEPTYQFYTTGTVTEFNRVAADWLGDTHLNVTQLPVTRLQQFDHNDN